MGALSHPVPLTSSAEQTAEPPPGALKAREKIFLPTFPAEQTPQETNRQNDSKTRRNEQDVPTVCPRGPGSGSVLAQGPQGLQTVGVPPHPQLWDLAAAFDTLLNCRGLLLKLRMTKLYV